FATQCRVSLYGWNARSVLAGTDEPVADIVPNMTTRINRRDFLAGVGMVAAAGRSVVAQSRQTRLVLLGTGGGPRPRTTSSASAQVIVSNGVAYVIDCGDG